MKKNLNRIFVIFSRSKIIIIALLVCLSFSCSPKDGIDGLNGPQGIDGPKGADGIDGLDGNANVRKYRITIAAADWSNGVHGGNGNIFNYYNLPKALTGNISLSDAKYLVLAYGEPLGYSYNQTKLLPYSFGLDGQYGIKFELDIARNQITMFKTTNGWNSSGLSLAERPSSFILDIYMIEISAAHKAELEIDIYNFEKFADYFDIN